MQSEVIISCAVTGAGNTPSQSPYMPVTPQQIAAECIVAAKAGAVIVHIHVCDSDTGAPSMRVEHMLKLRPELCSLDVATFNFGGHAFVNIPSHLSTMAKLIEQAGVKPELEVFDLGHVRLAAHMVERGELSAPPLFQCCMGVPWGAPATTTTALSAMRDGLPPGANWAAFGLSRLQFPMVAQAWLLGGHVRVGFKDNLFMNKGELTKGNAALVDRAVALLANLGATVASPATARRILALA